MSSLFNVISIIITFGLIVAIHEFGHFLFAKLSGIKVNEFAVGMGPKIAGWTRGETDYSVRALPLGGYCMMEGMAEDSKDENAFSNKSIMARLMVCFAGPVFNFILAFFLSIIICHTTYIDQPVLMDIMDGGAAQEAGFQVGDEIIRLDGGRIYNYREITLYSMLVSPEKPVEITYLRDGKEYTTTLKRKLDPETGNYYFGFISYGRQSQGLMDELKYSVYEVRFQIKTVVYSLKMLVTGQISKDHLMGPVGISSTMNTVIEETKEETKEESAWVQFVAVLVTVLDFACLLSANLGMMNLLPIPGLDGGRILFILIEAISGRPVPRDKENIVTAVGVIALLLLTVFVFFNDLGNVLHG
ncbi:regulator of sigma E protease [Lachnospiraceae bacterium NE2001]|nr:regulator of sigma E protease [Lachnospiraceae bacterium NE2001]